MLSRNEGSGRLRLISRAKISAQRQKGCLISEGLFLTITNAYLNTRPLFQLIIIFIPLRVVYLLTTLLEIVMS